jgi:glutathione synthase/RimK-type ligase-like ATP-grasp enzyme
VSSKKWVESKFTKRISSFSYFKKTGNELNFIDYLLDVIKTKKINVLLPIDFSSIRLISNNKNSFNQLNLIISSVKSLETANNKWELSKFLEFHNFQTPKTLHLNNIKLKDINCIKFPLILKPLNKWNGNEIVKINNSVALVNLLQTLNKDKEYIVQEFIEGQDLCVNVLCRSGEIIASSMQKGILPHSNPFKSHLGCEFFFKDKLYSLIQQIMIKLEWSGVANFDIRYNEDSDQYYIIEMNPRFWGSLDASTSVGVNFPYLYCCASLNIPFEIPDYKFEKYISNRGILKLIISKIMFKKINLHSIENNSLKEILKDPWPKLFKYFDKSVKILSLKKINLS